MTDPKLTPAMRRQLQILTTNRGNLNLATVEALMRRGLVVDNRSTREQLAIHCRMPSAYPLTDAGKKAASTEPA